MEGLNGHVLSPSEKTAIELSKPLLAEQYKSEVQFWGKVMGIDADYLIVRSTSENVLKSVITLYSTDGGLHWHLLDPCTPDEKDLAGKVRGLFTGDPRNEYRVRPNGEINGEEVEVPDPPVAPKDDEEEQPAPQVSMDGVRTLREASRLAAFIEDVDYNCRLAPRGALILDEHSNVVPNRTFEGLTKSEAGKLSNYFHARPSSNEKKSLLEKEGTNLDVDFLDSVVKDIPQGVWVFKYDPLLQLVTAFNLLYEGFVFYHKPGTPIYGQSYFGSGERNDDLCFLL
jgi:radial spoke head protein 9